MAATRLDVPAAARLRTAGLDYDGLLDALDAETARSLAAVGVTAGAPRFSPYVERPRYATSAKLALERSLKVAVARKDNHIGSQHIVLAILRAPTGTVPRALECAGVDRVELTARGGLHPAGGGGRPAEVSAASSTITTPAIHRSDPRPTGRRARARGRWRRR